MNLLFPQVALTIYMVVVATFTILTFYIMILLIKLLRKKLRE